MIHIGLLVSIFVQNVNRMFQSRCHRIEPNGVLLFDFVSVHKSKKLTFIKFLYPYILYTLIFLFLTYISHKISKCPFDSTLGMTL